MRTIHRTIPQSATTFWVLEVFKNQSRFTPLTHLVFKSVQQIDCSLLIPVARPEAGKGFQPRTLLALLILCYATKIYRSMDVEREIESNRDLRGDLNQDTPRAHDLRRFRRFNRASIEKGLAITLYLASQAGGAAPEMGLEGKTGDAVLTMDPANQEAMDRIEQAIWMDRLDLDD